MQCTSRAGEGCPRRVADVAFEEDPLARRQEAQVAHHLAARLPPAATRRPPTADGWRSGRRCRRGPSPRTPRRRRRPQPLTARCAAWRRRRPPPPPPARRRARRRCRAPRRRPVPPPLRRAARPRPRRARRRTRGLRPRRKGRRLSTKQAPEQLGGSPRKFVAAESGEYRRKVDSTLP